MNVRELFFGKVYERVKAGEDIVVVTPDLAAPGLDNFRRDFPQRYISVGIAEQNLITVACGLATGGKKVVAWGLNPFVVTRALDQIRNTVSLMNIPIIFSALHAGLSSAISGPTHVVVTDLSLVRTLGNITTFNVSDMTQASDLFDQSLQFDRPYYLRMDKDITYSIQREQNDWKNGFAEVAAGDGSLVISTGYHVKLINDILPALREKGIRPALAEIFRIPCDRSRFAEYVRQYQRVITVEEHILQGGVGSYVAEMLADEGVTIPIHRFGIDMEHGTPNIEGGRDFFERLYGLDKDSLYRELHDVLVPPAGGVQ